MANLKPDSPLCRRIVLSFLDFLNSVESSSASETESLEVAKDCLSDVFKIDSLSTSNVVPKSDSLIQFFRSETGKNEIKLDKINEESRADTSRSSFINNEVNEDELFGQFFGALEKVRYFGTKANVDDEPALDRATHLFHNALREMKKSRSKEIDYKNLADTFKLQGNKAMESEVYSEAIELYTLAIALCDDNAVYYCNRAAAYTQTKQYTEAREDCLKAIKIDPNYSKAYSRLGFAHYAQGYYRDAIDNGFKKALELDPNNESVRENIKVAEQKFREDQERRAARGQNVPPFTGIPTNHTGPFDLSGMLADMRSRRRAGNNPYGEPGVRVGNNPDDHFEPEVYEAFRSATQMFRDRDNGN